MPSISCKNLGTPDTTYGDRGAECCWDCTSNKLHTRSEKPLQDRIERMVQLSRHEQHCNDDKTATYNPVGLEPDHLNIGLSFLSNPIQLSITFPYPMVDIWWIKTVYVQFCSSSEWKCKAVHNKSRHPTSNHRPTHTLQLIAIVVLNPLTASRVGSRVTLRSLYAFIVYYFNFLFLLFQVIYLHHSLVYCLLRLVCTHHYL